MTPRIGAPNSFLLTHIVLHPLPPCPAGYGCRAHPYTAILRPGAALAQLVEHRIRNKKLYNKLYNENKVLDFFSDRLYTL